MKKLYLFLLFALLTLQGLADEGRYRRSFKSENYAYELRMLTHKYGMVMFPNGKEYKAVIETTWGLYDVISSRQLYTVKGDFSSKTVHVSNDGKNLVVIDDYSEEIPSPELKVLEFYAGGKLLNAYILGELLCSCRNISESVYHFDWFADSELTYAPDPKFNYDMQKLAITTFELVRYQFDVETGEILKKELHPAVNRNSALVYGEIKYLGREDYEIDVCHRVYGRVSQNGKMRFTSKRRIDWNSGNFQTVLLNNGQYIETGANMHRWILNQCRFKYGSQAERNGNNCL
ncbi:hypothetical protein [Pontibacter akesuensis]|uniref:Uncharacterized protein n=1 Tax=Pontibacter akesuensis TaxID=388950 RepID=A0A1I7FG29_9BACT|nr:hypothetical protein [Pontibacter akesuensis]GHA62320.1 hypothetical protein GCM10007389_13790 [Pontibacter akesuensis]SFU35173.1 hypothetical protein SAMN04487941_0177 [Pontibacter akesuensis]